MNLRTVRAAGVLVAALFLLSHFFPGPFPLESSPAAPHSPTGPGLSLVIYSQPTSPAVGLLPSSVREPDGSNGDRWAWDDFILARPATITEVRWSGGYDPARSGSGGSVANFKVAFYRSKPGLSEPDLAAPLVSYDVGTNAGEQAGANLGGVQMYDYGFILPAPFEAMRGVRYWVHVLAYQGGSLPDWGLTAATGGNGMYFRRVVGERNVYEKAPGDAAFTLIGAPRAEYPRYLPIVRR